MADFGRLTLDWSRATSYGEFGLRLGAERQLRRDNADRSSRQYQTGASWNRMIGRGHALQGRIDVALNHQHVLSESPYIDRDETSLRLGYQFARPMGAVQLGLWARETWTDYDYSPYLGGARADRGRDLGVDLYLPKAEYMGFAPVVGLSRSQNHSDVSLFERAETAVSLSLRSKF